MSSAVGLDIGIEDTHATRQLLGDLAQDFCAGCWVRLHEAFELAAVDVPEFAIRRRFHRGARRPGIED